LNVKGSWQMLSTSLRESDFSDLGRQRLKSSDFKDLLSRKPRDIKSNNTKRTKSIEKEEIELNKISMIERRSLEGSDNKLRFFLRKRDLRKLPGKRLSVRESFVKNKKKQRDRGEEETGRQKSKRDLSTSKHRRKKSTN
jgi:hypothetical protein